MKLLNTFILACCVAFTSTCSYADPSSPYQVDITFTNNSPNILYFTHYDGLDTNVLYFDKAPVAIKPGEQITLHGATTADYDLNGCVHLLDNNGHDNCLMVLDHRQFFSGQSGFAMNNRYYQSQTIMKQSSKTGGRFLDISTASVTITALK